MAKKISERARFDFIRYASCWEDADILVKGLAIKPGDKCLSIASGGDNSFALLASEPSLVVAADLNPAQLACVDLRIAAFKNLPHEDILKFLGILPDPERLRVYGYLKSGISESSREYWDHHHELVNAGIAHAGKFERFFGIFRNRFIPLMHMKKTVNLFIAEKTPEEQEKFYNDTWNNLRWKALFRIFFSKFMVGRLGRDPEFFKYVEDDVAGSFKKRADYRFTKIPLYTNPYVNYIFTGNFPLHALPFYLRKENFEKIKANVSKIKLYHGDINSCMKQFNVKFDAFNLSDIFEYMSYSEYTAELREIISWSNKGARIAYWNMMVDRLVPPELPLSYEKEISESLDARDMAPFYKRFLIAKVK